MPIPKRRKGEKRQDFINRCMGNEAMKKDYSDRDQRFAICQSQLRNSIDNLTSVLANYNTRIEEFEGRQHIVAPVVLLTEGVHHGSAGPMLYTKDELSKFASSWDGIPLPVYHPEDTDGFPIPANSPEVIEEKSVGRLFNVQYYVDGNIGKLKGELWVDIEKAEKVDPKVLDILKSHGELEVSTGVWFESDGTGGAWKGERYQSTAINFRPDHLALLPEGIGACSYNDGCGVRVHRDNTTIELPSKEAFQKALSLLRKVGHSEIRLQIQKEIDKLDRISEINPIVHYVVEVYDKFFIFRKETNQESALYKQGYSVDTDGKVQLKEVVQEVVEEVSYKAVNNRKEDDDMKKCCPEKVKALIENENNKWTEDDKEFLESLSEDQFSKLESEAVGDKSEEMEALTKTNEEQKETIASLEKKVRELTTNQGKKQTFEEIIKNADEDTKEMIESGISMVKNKKVKIIEALLKNKGNTFTEDELKTKKIDELEKLVQLSQVDVDYTGNGGGAAPESNSGAGDVLEMPEMNFSKKD